MPEEATPEELEAAATKVQSLQRQKQARAEVNKRRADRQTREVQGADTYGGGAGDTAGMMMDEEMQGPSLPFMEGDEMLKAYQSKAVFSAKRPVNRLIERSLLESAEAGKPFWWLEAPGNHALTFTSRMGDMDVPILCEVVSSFKGAVATLQRMDLSYNLLTDTGVETLAAGLFGGAEAPSSLGSLVLRGNDIGPRGVDTLCRVLRRCPSLRRLDVSQNPLGKLGGLAVAEFLQNNLELYEARVADCEIDVDSLAAIAAVLHVNNQSLRVCDVSNPRIFTLQEEHTVHFGRMLRVNTGLSEIYLGKQKIRDEGAQILVNALLENKTLRVLDLRCNEIGAQGAQSLGTLLRMDCQLQRLNLAGNRIGEKGNCGGAKALADSISRNRMLSHLDLNHNSLCGEALLLLADAVDLNSTLESLELFYNGPWDQAAAFKFYQVLNDKARVFPVAADFVCNQVEHRFEVCFVELSQVPYDLHGTSSG